MSISNEGPDVDRAILDAARACVEEFGVKRTTVAEVARRAGVSRPTVYRRWPDTRALVGELLTKELRTTLDLADVAGANWRERLVAAAVEGSALVRSNPLFDKIFRTDSDLVVTYIVVRLGRSQDELIARFADVIRLGQQDGSIRGDDAEQMATMLLLILQSAVQSSRIVAARLAGAALDREIRLAVDGFLRPV